MCDSGKNEEEVSNAPPLGRGVWACILGLLALVGCGSKGHGEGERKPAVVVPAVDLILVSQEAPWLVAAAAPVAAKLRGEGPLPLLAAIGSPPSEPMAAVLRQLEPKRAWLLTPRPTDATDKAVRRCKPELVTTGVDPVEGSSLIARQFWATCPEAVAARENDPRGLILAAALAARRSVPLLIRESSSDGSRFAEIARKLGVKRLTFVSANTAEDRRWARQFKADVELLTAATAQRQLAAALAADHPRTIILTRAPAPDGELGATGWLAPYFSLLRGAPLAVVAADDALAAETEVFHLMEDRDLAPQTLTILADYRAIGAKLVLIDTPAAEPNDQPKKEPSYAIDVEPCMPIRFDGVARLGVGRIPFKEIEDASTLLLRGEARTTLLDGAPAQVLLAANSRPDAYPLPLCETVSRLTAEEFANCGVKVDAFYGVPADTPSAMQSMRNAGIILFEGHTLYQDLFPAGHDLDEEPAEEESDFDAEDLETADRQPAGAPVSLLHGGTELPSQRPGAGELAGLPIVILQSCDSLKPQVFQRIHLQGGVALLGATSAIHSGSGSALAKAFCDSLLYRGASLGEALRDAQNFLICLQNLRENRNHSELAKIQRVALSFRLWGDPELRAFEGVRPRVAPVAAEWTADGDIEMRIPKRRLPTAATPAYVAALYPGSEASGIVQRVQGSAARRLSGVYFFRLPLSEGFEPRVPETLRDRAVLRLDRQAGLAYLVVMPQEEKLGATAEVRLRMSREKTKR